MNNENLKQRTRKFALDVIEAVEALPRDRLSDVLGRQLLRSATSVAANYRSATRAKSPADFVAKMGIVEEESDESAFWLDLLLASGRFNADRVGPLIQEAGELTAIAVASIRTARRTAAGTSVRSDAPTTPRSAFRTPRFAAPRR